MVTLEQVENLKKHANVSYEEAKAALEATDGDILEAVIYLEKKGKVEAPPNGGSYNTKESPKRENGSDSDDAYTNQSGTESSFSKQMEKLWSGFCELVKKGNANHFEVCREGKCVMSVPVNLLVLALLFFFWITIPALIICLFFGCTYQFKGPELGKDSINSVMDTVSETAEDLKNSFKSDAK